jgi:proteasome lid subunit RPN8/RPN11
MILRKLKNFWGYLQHNSHKQSLKNRIHGEINFDANQFQWNGENDLSKDLEGENLHHNDFSPLLPDQQIQTKVFDVGEKVEIVEYGGKMTEVITEDKQRIIVTINNSQGVKSALEKHNVLPPRLNSGEKKVVFQELRSPKSVNLPEIGTNISPHFKPIFVKPNPPKPSPKVSPRLDQVVWQDCEDVYRPTVKPIAQFLEECNITLSGKISPVYIEKKAYVTIIKHLKSDLQREQGGILFGNAYRDPKRGVYVKIVNAIPANDTLATNAHLEFTAQTWQGIMNYAKEIYLSENIVGWYHSHPNIGVFMSHTDLKTQEAFFSHPWCLSIVYDPVRHEIGYFLGKTARLIHPVIFNSGIFS